MYISYSQFSNHPGLRRIWHGNPTPLLVTNCKYQYSETFRRFPAREQISFRILTLTTVGGAAIATQSQQGGWGGGVGNTFNIRTAAQGETVLLLWTPSLNISRKSKEYNNKNKKT